MPSTKGTKHLQYPNSNREVVSLLKMQKHPEGGYFVETDRQEEQVPSPFADGKPRPLATTIYYLLTYEDPAGVFHMNKSVTMHVLHQGRAEYTLIHPSNPPRIETIVMGPNIDKGETLQLLVGSNVWKKSKLLDDDVAAADEDAAKRDRTGCLITEVVFPGFHWEDHGYLSRAELEKLWGGKAGWEEWAPFVKGE
ncbi:cupin domain-containing protein [Phanerochaete sordida]|uniref:Cupin domain-containing protein n=1 Tax=Phanerochaete sordida TaxID=48140 RepID=A0A9P3LDG8_9APHY|nr:cupin domain-containing protein [Phanerochaete sordida]